MKSNTSSYSDCISSKKARNHLNPWIWYGWCIICVIIKSDWVRMEIFVNVTWHVRNVLYHCVGCKADAAKTTCAFFFLFQLAAVVGGVAPLTRNHSPVSLHLQKHHLPPPVRSLTPFSAIWKNCWSTIPSACFFGSLYGYILGFSFWTFALGISFYLPLRVMALLFPKILYLLPVTCTVCWSCYLWMTFLP